MLPKTFIPRYSIETSNGFNINTTEHGDNRKEEMTAHHARDIVNINAGGTRYTTLYGTLAHSSSAYFLNFIRIDDTTGKIVLLHDRVIRDESGAIFVNRDGRLFAYVLQFIRDGKNTVIPKDKHLLAQLKREADFFGMHVFKCLVQETLNDLEREQRSENENADVAEIRNRLNEIVKNIGSRN